MPMFENHYIEKYVAMLKTQGKSESTIEGELKIIKLFLNNAAGKDPTLIGDFDIQEWQINLLNRGKKPSTVTRYTRVIYRFLKTLGVTVKVAYPRSYGDGGVRFLNLEQLKALYECLDDPRDKAIISLFAETGIKTSELINLRRRNVFEQSLIISPFQPYRVLNLTDTAQLYLVEYLNSKTYLNEEDLIFSTGVNNPHGKLSYASLNFIFKNITRRLSKTFRLSYKITPQILRNTFIYLQLVRGVPLELIRKQLGLKKSYSIQKIKALVKDQDDTGMRMLVECFKCKSMIQPHMKICPYCFNDLPNLVCDKCGRLVKRDFKFCPYCGGLLKTASLF
ncbi:MAG: zinc ribbon domain-containing protein [Candidatus Odinarchaeota archaeon]